MKLVVSGTVSAKYKFEEDAMLTYSIAENSRQKPLSRKTLFVEGKVDVWEWERLKKVILDSLCCCEELVVNLERAEECGDTFYVILCSVRENAKKVGKQLIIRGKGVGSISPTLEHGWSAH